MTVPYQGIDIEAMQDEIAMMRREIDQLYSFNGRQPMRLQEKQRKLGESPMEFGKDGQLRLKVK
jgi:hypothetical protein